MAFNDPLTVTIDSVARNLARIDFARGSSEYSEVTETDRVTAVVRSSTSKPDQNGNVTHRHNISVRQVVFATDTESEKVRQAAFTLQRYDGDSLADVTGMALGMIDLITQANLDKLVNYES